MKVKYNFIITPTLSSLQHFLWTTPFSLDFSLIKDLNLFDCWYKYVYIYKNINTLLTAHNGNHLSAHPWERFFFSTLLRSQHSLFVGSSLSMVEAPSFPHFLVTCWLESSLFMSCLVSNTDKTLWESWKYNLTVHFLFSSWQKARVEKWLLCVKGMLKRWTKQ